MSDIDLNSLRLLDLLFGHLVPVMSDSMRLKFNLRGKDDELHRPTVRLLTLVVLGPKVLLKVVVVAEVLMEMR